MSSIPYLPTGNTLTFFVNGRSHSIQADSANYAKARAILQGPDEDLDIDALVALTIPIRQIEHAAKADTVTHGTARVTVENGEVRYHGQQIHGVLAERMLNLLDEGWDLAPWFAFVENLYANPSEFARNELYEWLEKSDLPITPDGHFLAYKRVNDNYTSVHDGRTDNSIGSQPTVPRESVDADRRRHCSTGLHFCSKGYLGSFSGSRIVLLKINPADVVSIPDDYSFTKGRAWTYQVLSDITEEALPERWSAVHVAEVPRLSSEEIALELAAEAAAEAADVAAAEAKEAAIRIRDFKAEYAARIARGVANGLSKACAAGHYGHGR